MGQPITVYRADDGAIFPTEAEMNARDELLRGLARIEAFIEAESNWPRGEASRARRLIAAFLAFEREHGGSGLDEPASVA
jgi:hypothetical protein